MKKRVRVTKWQGFDLNVRLDAHAEVLAEGCKVTGADYSVSVRH